jgi:UDP-N-acetylmuramyl tripeptide synthase
MRFILSLWVCKLLIFLGKLTEKKGSSTPGKFALKICPDILRILSKKVALETVCVLGTNGKTTTNNMIDMIIKYSGSKTVCNTVGANMLEGVTTAFANSANLFGNLNADYAVIEVDEASAKIVFNHFEPDIIVITNLFRDQLDRYGEIDITIEHLKKAISMAPNAKLILNVDEPLCYYFSTFKTNEYTTYGISQKVLEQLDETKEARFCQCCGNELDYNYYHYSQLGDYSCSNCGFHRETPQYSADNVLCENKVSFTLNGNIQIHSNTYGFYNIYNMLAAIAVLDCLNIKIDNYSQAFSGYKPQIARMEEFNFNKPIILNLSKNPAGFNQAISTIANDPRKKSVVIAINDNAQDGYDVSWLYDVDFERLVDCDHYAVCGKRCYDMALRLFYANVCESPKIGVDPIPFAMEFLNSESEVIYVLVNYTIIFDAQTKLLKELKLYNREVNKNGN